MDLNSGTSFTTNQVIPAKALHPPTTRSPTYKMELIFIAAPQHP